MKKIAFFVLSVIALCSFASCQKNEFAPESGKPFIIKVSLPGNGNKAALLDTQLTWSAADKIVVSFTDKSTTDFTLIDGAGTANGTFSGILPEGKTVSGATAKSSDLFSDGKQIYSATEFPYSLVYKGNDLENLVFDFDESSYIALTLKGSADVLVSSITVNAGSDYVLDCGDGVALSEDGVPFYIMLTGEEVSGILKGIVVTTKGGKTMTVSVGKSFADMILDKEATSTKGYLFPSTKLYREDLFSGGAGTEAYPFKLSNAADIKNFAGYSNGSGVPEAWSPFDFATACYNVTGDITMGTDDVIAPAFTNSAAPFTGTFDGLSKTVTGLVINNTASVPCGLFSYAGEGSVIKDLKLMNVKVTSTYVETAAFVGHAEGATLTALRVDGNRSSTINSTANVTPSPATKYGSWGQAYMTVVGGIAGYAYNTNISNCVFTGEANSKYRLCGGIVAYAGGNTNISKCSIGKYSWVTSGDTICGGIVGASQSTGTVSECTVYGTIQPSGAYYGGGIVGAMNSGKVSGCTLQGATVKTTKSVRYVGGICGNISGGSPVIDGCKVISTTITDDAGLEVGFIVGYIDGGVKVTVSNCVVGSKCRMTASQWAGGILGRADIKADLGVVIDKCSSYGSISVNKGSSENLGGIAGYLSRGAATISNAYVMISNCLFEKGTLTATAASPNLGGIVGYCGVNKNPANESQEFIVNCYTKGVILSDSKATAYMSGIAGRSDYSTCIFGCWSDVVKGNGIAYPIFHWMYEFSYGNKAQHLYYGSSFSAPGNCRAGDKDSITPKEGISDFTTDDFLAKMNAAAAAYNEAPLLSGTAASSWVSATGGPTLSTAIADPDQ